MTRSTNRLTSHDLHERTVTFDHPQLGRLTGEARRPDSEDVSGYDPTWLNGIAVAPDPDDWVIVDCDSKAYREDACALVTQCKLN